MDRPLAPEPIVDLVQRVLGRPVSVVHRLGTGADHDAYDIDGALVARVARGADPDGIVREVRLLQIVGSVSPIPVPQVVAHDPSARVTIVTRLPGAPLLDRPCAHPGRLGAPLAELLAALHRVPVEQVRGIVEEDDHPLSDLHTEAGGTAALVAGDLPDDARRLVDRFIAGDVPPEPTERVLCHNDLGAEHILVGDDGLTITGVIDWSDAALADPAVDLGRVYRDLGPDVALDIARRLGLDAGAVIARAAFYARCALLEDLEYGISTGDHRYWDAAVANLTRTFDARLTS